MSHVLTKDEVEDTRRQGWMMRPSVAVMKLPAQGHKQFSQIMTT